MIIGICTSSKKLFFKNKPRKVIGFSATISKNFGLYYNEVYLRFDNEEFFSNFSLIIEKALRAYLKANKSLPL